MLMVRLTVVRMASYPELSARYELPQADPCPLKPGQVFVSEEARCPPLMCESAWQNLYPFVLTLACGGREICGSWMKDPRSALISCNDGFRPVSFLLEALPAES